MIRTPPREGALSEHPAIKATLRALNIVAGTLAALVAFVIVGLYAALENSRARRRTACAPATPASSRCSSGRSS